MAQSLVSDELWDQIQPLLPKHMPDPRGGAPRAPDRPCLEGILHVLKTGCQWQRLPRCQLWPSGSTCWRRFAEWTRAGVWPQLHRKLLNVLGQAGQIDLSAAVVDSASVRAVKGGCIPAPIPPIAPKTAVKGTSSAMLQVCRW
jgi:transposase